MTRSVVFKTPGKLDLRSIMTFGLNSKPNTGHPIGFFGTGLKYAIAVLVRNKIPVTFYIDQQKWTIDTEDSVFRDKTITEVFLTRHRKLLPPVHKKLPFTTELGKTWGLWQAFRELYSNTIDEKGVTFIVEKYKDAMSGYTPAQFKDNTWIVVEAEAFVQEFLDREKTFLPEGLQLREGTEDVQIFDKPSMHIYYRGIRVLDLDEKERGELTYNILSGIDLTEDRTAKDKFSVMYMISRAVVALEDASMIEKAVLSPTESFEKSLNYSWGTPSKVFLDTVSTLPSRGLAQSARDTLKTYRPPKVKAKNAEDWYSEIIPAIANSRWDDVSLILEQHRNEAINAFKDAQAKYLKEKNDNAPPEETGEEDDIASRRLKAFPEASGDGDIPF